MVKKLLAYVFVTIGLAAIGISSWPPLMHKIYDWNNAHTDVHSWRTNHTKMGGGDLIKLSYLDDIKKFWELKNYTFVKATDNGKKNIDLYLYGDSYTEDMPGYIFANVNKYQYGTKLLGLNYSLDSGKKNILLIEITERLALETLSGTWIYNMLKGKGLQKGEPAAAEQPVAPSAAQPSAPPKKQSYSLAGRPRYAQLVNTNIEYLLFDYNIINQLKQRKADMNYYLFNRASGDAAISDNGDYLFFKPTVVEGGAYSSYTPLTDNNINTAVSLLNEIYDHYKKEGFSEIYLSIIPNAATILQPKNYNRMIPRIQQNSALKMPVIDIYSIYSAAPDPATLYRRGDTHWNDKGMQIWLRLVNNELKRQSAQQ